MVMTLLCASGLASITPGRAAGKSTGSHYKGRETEVAKLQEEVSSCGDHNSDAVRQLKAAISTVVGMKPPPRLRGVSVPLVFVEPYSFRM